MLTVCCVWVQANVDYSVEYVTRLRSMVRRHLSGVPHDFVCFTDQPSAMPAGSTFIGIPRPPRDEAGWWSKLHIFNKKYSLKGQCIYFDLDVLLVRHIASLLSITDCGPMGLIPHAGNFNGSRGREVVKRFNSSVMVFTAEECHELYDECSEAIKHKLWGDQDWIGYRMPNLPMFPLEWFPRLSEINHGQIPSEARVILCKRPKNAEAAQRWRWFEEMWQ